MTPWLSADAIFEASDAQAEAAEPVYREKRKAAIQRDTELKYGPPPPDETAENMAKEAARDWLRRKNEQ